jgi:hypothetical protein
MLNVHWFKCKSGDWCSLATVNLDTVTESGVYIIWHAGNPGSVVYVGQGNPIAPRLASHRTDARIQKYKTAGNLYFTWAVISAGQQDGVERYLADWLHPLVGDAHPNASPIQVNSPWAA